MITCKELTDFLDDYLAGDCSDAERRSFDEHLAACPDCVNYLAQYRRTIALGRQAFGDLSAPLPQDVPAGLLKALLAIPR